MTHMQLTKKTQNTHTHINTVMNLCTAIWVQCDKTQSREL